LSGPPLHGLDREFEADVGLDRAVVEVAADARALRFGGLVGKLFPQAGVFDQRSDRFDDALQHAERLCADLGGRSGKQQAHLSGAARGNWGRQQAFVAGELSQGNKRFTIHTQIV
jgi:hypothetical protein